MMMACARVCVCVFLLDWVRHTCLSSYSWHVIVGGDVYVSVIVCLPFPTEASADGSLLSFMQAGSHVGLPKRLSASRFCCNVLLSRLVTSFNCMLMVALVYLSCGKQQKVH